MNLEWERQEAALRDVRHGAPPGRSHADPYYVAVMRELRQPLDQDLGSEFARQVAAQAIAATARRAGPDGALENALLYGAMATLGLALVWIFGVRIGSGGLEALLSRMAILRDPWLGLAMAGGALSWALSRGLARAGRNDRDTLFG
jgi:hypothetical protein